MGTFTTRALDVTPHARVTEQELRVPGDGWNAEIKSSDHEGPIDVEFKLVLDGHQWMTGWNQHGRTAHPRTELHYDDSSVGFD